ncbi:uncharacterized protein LOC124305940 [Neodiprion virginianus]|uniref:uncharacterized protein LOC124305940 n=1 Tax=Neodiprion virginianus TaxID=2961670 RepID=UPI001EE77340|nr:uncharacterized protein LOC124305940 [Neodiprion virginianus]
MVKYHPLFQKPQVTAWACISRRLKFIFFYGLFVGLVGLVIHVAKTNSSLSSIYNLQSSLGDMLDLEMRYLPKTNGSTGWKQTSVKEGHIYSAYLDTRPEQILQESHEGIGNETTWAMVRIIAILPRYNPPVTCFYKYRGKQTEDGETFLIKKKKATRTKPVAISEGFNMYYSAFFVLCDLTMSAKMDYEEYYSKQHLPYEITIAPGNITDSYEPKNDSFVPIFYPENGISMAEFSTNFMAVCVPVLHHNFDRVTNLVEFVEFYRMMGVGHFTFYNRSISSRVGKVLEHYRDNGVATILPWDLPPYFIFEKNLRVDGIFAALNDCLYRSSFHKSYMYVASVDIDEFIVPRKHKDYLDMMQYLDPIGPHLPLNDQASFLFRNMFFYLMFDDDPVTLAPEIPKLYTQSKTTRTMFANPGRERSKYIVRSRQTVELGNHHTWELRKTASAFNKRYKEVTVDVQVAASQHYRSCETNIETCWLRQTVKDTSAHKFTAALGERVSKACKGIFENGCPEDVANQRPDRDAAKVQVADKEKEADKKESSAHGEVTNSSDLNREEKGR